jgi:hypothetical protein
MPTKPASSSVSSLATIDLRASDSAQRGRAFFAASDLDKISVDNLKHQFAESFIKADDEERLRLLAIALSAPRVVVETYPGENEPIEYHCYVRSPTCSDKPLFACVLATNAVVQHLLSFPPHVVLETATFEVIGEEATSTAMRAGVESWARRVWPTAVMPAIKLVQWPDIEEASSVADEFIELPKIHLPNVPMRGAQERLSIEPVSIAGDWMAS